MVLETKSLPFSIGSEIELQIVDEKGSMLRGERLIAAWETIFKQLKENFDDYLELLPREIRSKVLQHRFVTKDRQGKKLYYLEIQYRNLGSTFSINIFGPDPNISQITWIMELVTPPCSSLEEFTTWNVFLNRVLLKVIPPSYHVLPIGLNPVEEKYMSGVTYGEHYHVGITDPSVKLAAYNLIRNYVPHLIALTTNSPFINGGPTGTVKVIDKGGKLRILGKDCTRSLRLHLNKGQMGPVDKETYIPPLDQLDHEEFCNVVRRNPPDDRFTDVYPFTSYETIEIRIFDTQFSIARRAAIVALLEAMCLKARNLVKGGVSVPGVKPAVLIANREKAIKFGLFGKFTADTLLPRSFQMIYNEDPSTGQTNGKLFQAVRGMFEFFRKEIKEIDVGDILSIFFKSIDGSPLVVPPFSPADFLLYIYKEAGGNIDTLIRELMGFQREFCTDFQGIDHDPLLEEWKGSTIEDLNQESQDVSQDKSTGTGFLESLHEIASINENQFQVDERSLVHDGAIPYTLSFILEMAGSSPTSVNVLLIQQLVETLQKTEHVLSTAFKNLDVPVGEEYVLDQSLFPLVPERNMYVGNKQCRLKMSMRIGNMEHTMYSNSFWLELLPRVHVSTNFKRYVFKKDDIFDIPFNLSPVGTHAEEHVLDLDVHFQVISLSTGNILYKRTRKVRMKEEATTSFKVRINDFLEESLITFRLVVECAGVTLARYEYREVEIRVEEEDLKPAPRVPEPRRVPTNGVDSSKSGMLSRGLVKRLDFSSASSKEGEKKGSSKSASSSKMIKRIAVVKSTETEKKSRKQTHSPPSQKAPKVQVKTTTSTSSSRQSSSPESSTKGTNTSFQPKISERMASSAGKSTPRETKGKKSSISGQKIAEIFSESREREAVVKETLPFPVPFSTPGDVEGFKVSISAKLHSPKLVAPGNKIQVAYNLNRIKSHLELGMVTMVAFLVNKHQDVIVVERETHKVTGNSFIYNLSFDPAKTFKFWTPTDEFFLILQVYEEKSLVGQDIITGFKPVRFTTDSQVKWKKIELLANTIYPSMDAAVQLEFDVRSMVQPFPLLLQARCQNMTMEQEIMVEREGVNHFFIPVHMPDHRMTPVQNAPFSLKILDASGVQIKESRETVSIVPYGPLFAIKSLRINQAGGIDQFEVVVDLFNDGKVKATLNADLLIKIPTRSELESLDSQKLTLDSGASKQIVFTKINLPLDAITHETFKLFVLITVTSFQKVKNLLVRDIKPESMIPMKERVIILGDIKNLDNTRKITNETDKVSLEVELHWKIPLHKCKVKLIEFLDGTEYTVLKTFSIPKKKMDLYTSIYWSPPKAKKHPRFCKLELRLYQDDQRVAGDAVQFTSRFFTIYP